MLLFLVSFGYRMNWLAGGILAAIFVGALASPDSLRQIALVIHSASCQLSMVAIRMLTGGGQFR
jgi:hypothetical protein